MNIRRYAQGYVAFVVAGSQRFRDNPVFFLDPLDRFGYNSFNLFQCPFRCLAMGCQRGEFKAAGNMDIVIFRPLNAIGEFLMSCFMVFLQFFDCLFHLYNLVRFCHLAVPLQVDSRISGPRCFEYVMAACDSRLSEITLAKSQQIIEGYVADIVEDLDVFTHG